MFYLKSFGILAALAVASFTVCNWVLDRTFAGECVLGPDDCDTWDHCDVDGHMCQNKSASLGGNPLQGTSVGTTVYSGTGQCGERVGPLENEPCYDYYYDCGGTVPGDECGH